VTTRATRGILRTAVAALLTAPAAGALLLAGAAPAHAGSGSITKPAANASFSSGDSVVVEAAVSLGRGQSAQLKITGPGLGSGRVTSKTNTCTSITCPSSQNYTLSDSRVPISSANENGRFTITLSGDGISATRSFTTDFAPGTPSSVAAKGTGASRVDVTWSYDGTETDLAGFVVSDDKGNSYPVNDPAARSYTALYDNPEPGTYDYAFTVKALRKNGAGDGTVAGSSSSPASAQLVTPQPPSPTPSPSSPAPGGGGSTPPPGGGGSTPGTGGGSTGGGSTGGGSTGGGSTGGTSGGSKTDKPVIAVPTLNPIVQQRRSYALSFNRFSPSLGIPKLPPLPATTFKTTEGTFAPTLPYEEQSQEQEQPGNLLADPIRTVTSLDSEQLAENIAIALVLLVAGAHIRLFLAGNRE